MGRGGICSETTIDCRDRPVRLSVFDMRGPLCGIIGDGKLIVLSTSVGSAAPRSIAGSAAEGADWTASAVGAMRTVGSGKEEADGIPVDMPR